MEIGVAAALTQGGFYFLTGIWPIISIKTFQLVTGPKNDLWLVKTVGVLISVIGAALLLAGYKGEIVPSQIYYKDWGKGQPVVFIIAKL